MFVKVVAGVSQYTCILFSFLHFSMVSSVEFERVPLMAQEAKYDWMDKQIQADLEPFQKTGISNGSIRKVMKEAQEVTEPLITNFVHFKIYKNQISYRSYSIENNHPRLMGFTSFFNNFSSVVDLPNVEFVVSFSDLYECPSCLKAINLPPIWTISKIKGSMDGVIYPDLEYFFIRPPNLWPVMEEGVNSYPWHLKQPIAFWRGATTGAPYFGPYLPDDWVNRPRGALILCSKNHPELLDAAFVEGRFWISSMACAAQILNCKPLSPVVSIQDQLQYKYLVAVDGNSWPSNQLWALLSNSVVLKNVTDILEWYHCVLVPYVHYVPYKQDCSDLPSQIEYLIQNDELAQQIANQATEFFHEHLSEEAMALYIYKLLNYYAALQMDEIDDADIVIDAYEADCAIVLEGEEQDHCFPLIQIALDKGEGI